MGRWPRDEGPDDAAERYAIEAGDLAILSNEWTLTAGDQSLSAVTAEVPRLQPDGHWLYVVDHPFASMESEELAALAAALPR